jgi:hypothetical protein
MICTIIIFLMAWFMVFNATSTIFQLIADCEVVMTLLYFFIFHFISGNVDWVIGM